MTSREVEAVWIFRYEISHYKAVYGRFSSDTTYTKNHLQVGRSCEDAFERIIGRKLALEEEEPFVYKWPGGQMDGKVKRTTDRLSLRWLAPGAAPPPWRLAPNISSASLETFEGNPDHTTPADANAEWDRFNAEHQEPWLVVAKLKDEANVLHLRAYLGAPPEHLMHCCTAQLPSLIRSAMADLPNNKACGVIALFDSPPIDPDLRRLFATLETNPNVLLVGPPGTGKTVLLDKLTDFVEHGPNVLWFDPDRNHDAFSEFRQGTGKTRTIVLHPSYSYENLVLGLLPTSDNGAVGVRVTTGPLINLAHYANGLDRRALLVLDEFNRGNAAAILGDFLALLDVDKRRDPAHGLEGAAVDLPYADNDNMDIYSGPRNLDSEARLKT